MKSFVRSGNLRGFDGGNSLPKFRHGVCSGVIELRLNFWISFKGESVVDFIISCGAVAGAVTWGRDTPSHLLFFFYPVYGLDKSKDNFHSLLYGISKYTDVIH